MNIIFKIVIFALLGIVAIGMLFQIFALLGFFFHLAIGLLMLAAAGYAAWFIFQRVTEAQRQTEPANYKLSGNQEQICVFRSTPSLADIVKLADSKQVEKLKLAGELFTVDKDSAIVVLSGMDDTAVRVRIRNPVSKEQSEGWVDKSNLVKVPNSIAPRNKQ